MPVTLGAVPDVKLFTWLTMTGNSTMPISIKMNKPRMAPMLVASPFLSFGLCNSTRLILGQ